MNIRNLIFLLTFLLAAGCESSVKMLRGRAFTVHRPEVADNRVRHFDLRESLGDGYIRFDGTGILGPDGKVFLEPIYDKVEPFGRFFAVAKGKMSPWKGDFTVVEGKGVNLMRRDGTLVFDKFQAGLKPFTNGFGIVRGHPDGLLPSHLGRHLWGESPAREALFDEDGRILGNRWFKKVGRMQDGVAFVQTDEGLNFILPDGSMLAKTSMGATSSVEGLELSDFSEGRVIVRRSGRAAYFDKTLQRVSPRTYRDAKPFSEGYAAVQTQMGWHIIDAGFNFLGGLVFKEVEPYHHGFALVKNQEDQYNLVDTNGSFLLPQWQKFATGFKDGYAIIGEKGRYTYIDGKGRRLTNQWYETAQPFEGGFARVQQDRKFNHIDLQGRLASNIWFDKIKRTDKRFRPLHPYKLMVINERQGLCNFLNEERQVALKDWFTSVAYEQRLLVAQYPSLEGEGRDFMILDLEGEPVLQDRFDLVHNQKYGFLHIERHDKKENLMDAFSPEGGLISDQWFDRVGSFSHGRECVQVRRDGLENLMYADGSFLLDPWSQEVVSVRMKENKFLYTVKMDNGYEVLDRKCQSITDERFSQVKDNFSLRRLCVKKDRRWYTMAVDGTLTPTLFKECQ